MNIPSARPFFSKEAIESILGDIKGSLEAGVLTQGPYMEKFENLFAEYVGVKNAIAVNSGTSALEIVLRYFDVKDREVIVPTNSFVASANTVIFAGGQPVLADIKPDTLCIDPDDVRQRITSKTRCIMVVHLAGLVCPQMDELKEICRDYGLFLIEDAAQAHGATADGKKAGCLGGAGCFSFFPTKVMTTGEGGIITTDDDNLAEFARIIRNHGREGDLHVRLGYNWRMSEVNAILGIYQVKRLEQYVERRNEMARRYAELLAKTSDIILIPVPSDFRHSYYKYPVLFPESVNVSKLEKVLKEDYGIATGALYYPPIHLQPLYGRLYGYEEGMLPVAEDVLRRQLCLPMFIGLSDEEIDYTVNSLKMELSSQ